VSLQIGHRVEDSGFHVKGLKQSDKNFYIKNYEHNMGPKYHPDSLLIRYLNCNYYGGEKRKLVLL